MGNVEKLNAYFLSLKNYYNYLHECDRTWNQASMKAREIERDLLVLSDQLRCLSSSNQTKLSSLDIQKTADQIILLMEEKYSPLSMILESAVRAQDELLHLRHKAELQYYPVENNNIAQRLIKNVYVSWLYCQMRSSSVNASVKMVNFKSPESIRQLFQNIYGSEDFKNELKEALEIAENLLRNFELFL